MAVFLSLNVANKTLTFDADIFNVLDMGEQFVNVNKIAAKPFENKAMLLVSHPNAEVSKAFLQSLKPKLIDNPAINSAIFNPNQQFDMSELSKLYGNYPLAFLSKEAQSARKSDDYNYLVERYIYLLSQPANPLVSLTINDAPLLNLADWFSEQLVQSNWQQDGEYLYAQYQDQHYFPIFLELKPSAVSLDQIVQTVYELDEDIKQSDYFSEVQIAKSGLIFHSAAVTEQARFETQLFGGLSLIGILLLTLINFRSIRPIVGISLIIASAVLAGMVSLVIIFSQIHLLALVFAVSLIGIAVDYGYHILLTAKHTGKSGSSLSNYIAPALLMGGGTTLVSYLLLLVLPIPLLHQVAVFVGAGIVVAIFTGLTVVTFLSGNEPKQASYDSIDKAPLKGFKWVAVSLVLLCLVAISQWKFNDDINIFNSTPQVLIDNEVLVNKVAGNMQYPRFFYVEANNQEQMLQRFEAVREAILNSTDESFELRGIDSWVPSAQTQQRNANWLVKGLANNGLIQITGYLDHENITQMKDKSDQFITIESLPKPILDLYPAFGQSQDGLVGVLSYMGPIDQESLNDINEQLDFSITYFDQPTQLSAALTQLRVYIGYFLSLAALALCLVSAIRYGLKDGLVLALIPITIAASALAVTQLVFGFVTIFNLLSCILIMALSIDYVIFIREHGRKMHVLRAITLSAITSGLAFGIMVFSQTPAILHFGVTILFGVTLAWIVCQLLPLNLMTKSRQ